MDHMTMTQYHNFDRANAARVTRAAQSTAARAARALDILNGQAPQRSAAVGEMRVANPTLSLTDLGALFEPPLSKDAVAGHLRRLFGAADRMARKLGVPDTLAAATHDTDKESVT